jgi:hypothetical protein
VNVSHELDISLDRGSQTDLHAMLGALDALRGHSPEYGGFLANHGPMAVDALIRLGGAARAPGWIERYRRGLHDETPPGDDTPPASWARSLGDIGRLGGWVALYRRAVSDHGWRATVDVWWPRLLPGAAASATHGIIRTAHAVRNLAEHGDDEPLLVAELVEALGYWAARWQPLPGAPALEGPLVARAAIAALPRLGGDVASRGPGISGRLGVLGALGDLPRSLDAWGPGPDDEHALDDLIGAAARILASRPEAPIAFCHAVTAPAAVRMVLPYLPVEHRRATVAACWQVVASIVAAFASPRTRDEGRVPWVSPPSPAQLARRAIAHGDEHVLKLTEACLRQFSLTGDATLLVAADRFARRMPPQP